MKTLYGYDQSQDRVRFNNKDILVDGKPVYINEWFKKGVVSIKDLLKNDGNSLTFKEFSDKYGCQTNFLQYYQIISVIPNRLLAKAKDTANFNKLYFTSNNKIFNLNDTVQINLGKAKSKDFYKLLNDKTHTDNQTGAKRWSKSLSLNEDSWCRIFKSLKNVCKEIKLKEFHFKFIHRIIVTKREVFKFGIKKDDECIYCGENDSIDHTFIECSFTKAFSKDVCKGLTQQTRVRSPQQKMLFGVISDSYDRKITKKFNYTTLFMRHYLYSSKLNNKAISLHEFTTQLKNKCRIENNC